ncbi:MAG: potassium-transporting ATPase subunit KdpC [Burkholderiaceae bacterium]
MHAVFRPALVLFGALTFITGVAYPLAVTVVAQAAFAERAAGSLAVRGGKVVGSTLIGQTFTDPKHFWGRPSATGPMPTNAGSSGGSNLGPTNPALFEAVKARAAALRAADPANAAPIPVDLVTASASGLDPEISVAAARWQAARVADARGLPRQAVLALIDAGSRGRAFGFLGEPRVDVLALNLALDNLRR